MGIAEMGQGEWGSDWAKARKKNVDVLQKLQRFLKQVGGNSVLISHAKTTVVTAANDDNLLATIRHINRTVHSKLPTNTLTRNVTWQPKKFEFSNMFSYG